ncbi:MAG: hypothetical protein OXT67_02455, partial [Zetaproteobacteria bacterium]|nr:hypothetical protein [Zetaproteobacteria bacterium]
FHPSALGYLRSDKGVYIGVEGEEVVQKSSPGPWEIFERERVGGRFGFRNVQFNRYLSFEGKLRTRPHLRDWELFDLEWRYGERKVSTGVYLIEGGIPFFPAAKHGGLLFVDNYAEDGNNYAEDGNKNATEAHFMHKDYFLGWDGEIVDAMPLMNKKLKKLGDVDLSIREAMVWARDWAKNKKYRVSTFNCWKLPIAFSKQFGLNKVKEPSQNDLLRLISFLPLSATLFPGALYSIFTGAKKI